MVRIWRIDTSRSTDPRKTVHVGSYLINGPWNMLWSWWTLYCVSLADAPGIPPARKHRADASHEIAIWSMNPDIGVPNLEDVEAGGQWRTTPSGHSAFLSPPDVVTQVWGLSDEQAGQVLDLAAQAIARGMSPDQDYRTWWNTAIQNAAKHARGEAEPGEHRPPGDSGVSA
jgi:hypothetical protein